MAQTLRIETDTGGTDVACFWSNGTLAVTRDIGEITPSGHEREPDDNAWTITHVASGRSLGGFVHEDAAVLVALAERLMPVVPWHLPFQSIMADPANRQRANDAMRHFLATRRTGEGA